MKIVIVFKHEGLIVRQHLVDRLHCGCFDGGTWPLLRRVVIQCLDCLIVVILRKFQWELRLDIFLPAIEGLTERLFFWVASNSFFIEASENVEILGNFLVLLHVPLHNNIKQSQGYIQIYWIKIKIRWNHLMIGTILEIDFL